MNALFPYAIVFSLKECLFEGFLFGVGMQTGILSSSRDESQGERVVDEGKI